MSCNDPGIVALQRQPKCWAAAGPSSAEADTALHFSEIDQFDCPSAEGPRMHGATNKPVCNSV